MKNFYKVASILFFILTTIATLCFTFFYFVLLGNASTIKNRLDKYSTTASISPLFKDIVNNGYDVTLLYSELEDLDAIYYEISVRVKALYPLQDKILEYYYKTLNAPVCSKANRFFNLMKEKYDTYLSLLSETEKYISIYEEKYNNFSFNIDVTSAVKPVVIYDMTDSIFQYNELINSYYFEAKEFADNLFDEYFDLMCHIVNAEAGSNKCTAQDHYYVANVIENRIEHPKFPNTIYDVVYSPGQYVPVENGSIKRTPTDIVIQNIEFYLRGNVETGMPKDVVYQAKGKQGTYVWKYLESSGHYFCGIN